MRAGVGITCNFCMVWCANIMDFLQLFANSAGNVRAFPPGIYEQMYNTYRQLRTILSFIFVAESSSQGFPIAAPIVVLILILVAVVIIAVIVIVVFWKHSKKKGKCKPVSCR